jgi:hypothetical protein
VAPIVRFRLAGLVAVSAIDGLVLERWSMLWRQRRRAMGMATNILPRPAGGEGQSGATASPGEQAPSTCQKPLAIGRNGAKALPARGSAAASSGQWRKIMLVMPLLAIQSIPSGE